MSVSGCVYIHNNILCSSHIKLALRFFFVELWLISCGNILVEAADMGIFIRVDKHPVRSTPQKAIKREKGESGKTGK